MPTNIEKLSDAELVAASMEKLFGWKLWRENSPEDTLPRYESPGDGGYEVLYLPPLDGNLMLKIMVELEARDILVEIESGADIIVYAWSKNYVKCEGAAVQTRLELPRAVYIVALMSLEQANA